MTAPVFGLTPAQADCARVIAALTSFEGKGPSFAEVSDEMCIHSKGRVWVLVQALIERGWIKRPYFNATRALRLTRSPPPFDYGAIDVTDAGRAYLDKAA